jgi:hypothetical protein
VQESATHAWAFVPYTCYYHIFTVDEGRQCQAGPGLSWLLTVGGRHQHQIATAVVSAIDGAPMQLQANQVRGVGVLLLLLLLLLFVVVVAVAVVVVQ